MLRGNPVRSTRIGTVRKGMGAMAEIDPERCGESRRKGRIVEIVVGEAAA